VSYVDPWNGDYLPDGTAVPVPEQHPDMVEAGKVEPEAGGQLLDDVEVFLRRFVVYPSEHELVAHVLWVAHCWFMDVWESTPRIAFLSPEPASGKSRALEVTDPLVPRAVQAVNVTSAYLFRKVSDAAGSPTVLFDEIDTVFGPKAKENEEVRGMLNAGHRRGATAGRCVVRGKEVFTEDLPAYCAVALAGLDDLPDTIRTRSVIVRMRRRGPGERVEAWRRRINFPQGNALGERLARWSSAAQSTLLVQAWPFMPTGVDDRDADVWEPLLMVAELVGGDWPSRARAAASYLVERQHQGGDLTLGVLLLRDLRTVFVNAGAASLATETILVELTAMDESPWGDLHGKPLDARGLSRRLRKYEIRPATHRDGATVFKGYTRAELADVWARYLPADKPTDEDAPAQPLRSVTSVTTVTAEADGLWGVTDVTDVTAPIAAKGAATGSTASRTGTCGQCGEPLERPGLLARCRPDHTPEVS